MFPFAGECEIKKVNKTGAEIGRKGERGGRTRDRADHNNNKSTRKWHVGQIATHSGTFRLVTHARSEFVGMPCHERCTWDNIIDVSE